MKKRSKLPANILRLPVEARAEIAIQAGVKRAIVRRSRLGLPIYIWHDGKVVEMSSKEVKQYLSETS